MATSIITCAKEEGEEVKDVFLHSVYNYVEGDVGLGIKEKTWSPVYIMMCVCVLQVYSVLR